MPYSWSQPISLRGSQGPAGVGFTKTTGKPTDQGQLGEMRLDPAAFVIWSWDGSDWQPSQSFAGSVGAVGPADFVGFGDTDPNSNTYAGDAAGIYFQRVSGAVWLYTKQAGWYDSGTNTKGPPGQAGRRGSVLFEGSGPPSSDPSTFTVGDIHGALPGDQYRDTSSSDLKEYYFS